ncbi:MAG: 23S rRNA (uracil(1939)-C(5))-methyltransferase RlmD [Betaproteobacteria bacterium]|nr:23S rRNA (uracil(1939)-C(5))-methyltransferase RlmD [Betaproteobacteria bacterium]
MPTGIIESLDHEARGITRLDGKTVFVEGALPGERVEFSSVRKKPTYELARITRLIRASSSRVPPRCAHFGVCGGCSMQHCDPAAQVAAKQRVLEDNLWHIGRLKPEEIFAPIHGNPWGYRHRARLSVRLVEKKGGMLVGFHEKRSSYIADMRECHTLPPALAKLLLPMRELFGALSIRERLPQVEVAVGERATVLVLRVLEPLSAADEMLTRDFAQRHGVHIHLQPRGPDSVVPFYPEKSGLLSYSLPDFDIELAFGPTEFTQVNPAINRVLVRRAMALLEVRRGERIFDMFCGLGNFSLPMARLGASVLGIEGSAALVRRAEENALKNGLGECAEFAVADLFKATPGSLSPLGPCAKMLIDPPREGAAELIKALAGEEDAGAEASLRPQRIVYVSCNPATLARDAAILIHQKGYRLLGAGVVNMFPQTSHVESIALFRC